MMYHNVMNCGNLAIYLYFWTYSVDRRVLISSRTDTYLVNSALKDIELKSFSITALEKYTAVIFTLHEEIENMMV